jgi:replicative DNA helicase
MENVARKTVVETEAYIHKNRNGPTGKTKFTFLASMLRFGAYTSKELVEAQ